jgi:hypothetical protein
MMRFFRFFTLILFVFSCFTPLFQQLRYIDSYVYADSIQTFTTATVVPSSPHARTLFLRGFTSLEQQAQVTICQTTLKIFQEIEDSDAQEFTQPIPASAPIEIPSGCQIQIQTQN